MYILAHVLVYNLLNTPASRFFFVVNNNTTKKARNIYIYMYISERFMGFFYNAIKDWKAFARDLGNVYLNKI